MRDDSSVEVASRAGNPDVCPVRNLVVRYNAAALKSAGATTQSPESIRLDVTLVERLAARDASALGELYDRHGQLLYGLILRILRDRGEAEEVLQEVFVLVWNRVATYDVALGSPAAWLVRIARNRAIDRLRANAVRSRVVESLPFEIQSTENPEAMASVSEWQRAVMRALDAIPREQRNLIEDAYYLGFTQSELAERHNLPLGTVKTRIRTGLLSLREQLSQISVQQ